MSHDLKNPLGAIIGMADLTIEDSQENDLNKKEVIEQYKLIRENCRRLLTLFDDLLTLMTLEKNNIHPEVLVIQLREKINDQLALLLPSAELKNISLINNIEDNTKIMTNDDILNTIIRNLVSNAIKFTQEGGEISVSSSSENGSTIIFIKDNGIGLSKERLSNIFNNERYTTLGTNKEKGTGFGLQICKEMIEKMGGTIEAQSEGLNMGTTFIIKLPKE